MVVSLHFFHGSPLSRNEPSRFPKVISEEERVSATLARSKKGLSDGGSLLVSGNADPSMISPTPVITIFLGEEVESGAEQVSLLCKDEGKAVLKLFSTNKGSRNSLNVLVIILFKSSLIKRLAGL
jgi:hypothetical protein